VKCLLDNNAKVSGNVPNKDILPLGDPQTLPSDSLEDNDDDF
jgi:hypothetical protein